MGPYNIALTIVGIIILIFMLTGTFYAAPRKTKKQIELMKKIAADEEAERMNNPNWLSDLYINQSKANALRQKLNGPVEKE